MDLLQLNARGGELNDQDLLLQARLLARRPELSSRKKAVGVFEHLNTLKPRPTSADDQLILAKLYERADQWAKCRSADSRNRSNSSMLSPTVQLGTPNPRSG